MSFFPSFSPETWALLTLFFTLLFTYSVWSFGFFKKVGIPGPRPLPFIGSLWSYKKGFHNFDMECFNKYGNVWGIFEGKLPVLMITDPAMLKTIMVKECYTIFTNRRDLPVTGPLSDAVSIAKDEQWRRIRGSLSPSFTSGHLKEVFPIIQRYADNMINSLKKRNLEEPVQIKDILGPYCMDVITSTSFSVEMDSINNPNDPFLAKMKKLLKFSFSDPIVVLTILFPFLAPLCAKLGLGPFATKNLDFFFDSIRKIKNEHQDNHSKRVDFLQLMVQSQISAEQADTHTGNQPVKGLTDHEILSQSLIFIMAGYETTSNSLCFLLYNLATNPAAMKRLLEEIDEVFPNETPVTYNALLQMEYLDMVLSESARLWPVAPRIERACKTTVEVNGVTIPKGTLVAAPVYVMHRNPQIWESPDSFRPERFSSENKESIDPYTYLPFGIGPRNCIGMRFALLVVKLAVVKLLQNFDVDVCKETEIPLELNTIFQPNKPITLKFVPRAPFNSEE